MMITFKRPDGKECSGYYLEPAGLAADAAGGRPGVVVIQEWWGLNEQIKGVARRLAEGGYRVLVPDLYRGQLGVEVKEAEHLMNSLDFGDAATEDIRGAVQHIRKPGTRAGVLGFCMGGALTLLAACNVPELDTAVCWYGVPPLEYIDAAKIKIPLMGHFAIDDAFFPISLVDQLEKKLQDAGVKYEFHRYKAQHAFGNETVLNLPIPARYDQAAAELAWLRTVEFLKRTLG